jgi:hypothetical protein
VTSEPVFQLVAYLQALADHLVDYVVVGGVGARIQGAAVSTQDLDIMVEPSPENLARLADAIRFPETEFQRFRERSFEVSNDPSMRDFMTDQPVRVRCRYGVLDVLPELPGVGGYAHVASRAGKFVFREIELRVADLQDIIVSKQTADRVKDMHTLDALHAAQQTIRQNGPRNSLDDSDLDD